MRKLRFTARGLAENPIGQHVTWNTPNRTFLVEVTGGYRDATLGMTFLKTRHFNGETGPDVVAAVVNVLEQTDGTHR